MQLLEEMVDNGYPLITEPNALRTMIKPPTFSHRVSAFMTVSVSYIVCLFRLSGKDKTIYVCLATFAGFLVHDRYDWTKRTRCHPVEENGCQVCQ